MLLLIDADILVFRAGMMAERQVWFLSVGGAEPEQFVYKKEALERLDELLPGIRSRVEGEDYQMWQERFCEPLENALQIVKTMVQNIKNKLDVTDFDIKMCMSDPKGNFRHRVAKTTPYKGNRDANHRPTHEEAIRTYIRSKWDTAVGADEEADDLMGYLQNQYDTCIVTIDKDLDMIPGWHYNFVKDDHYFVDEAAAMNHFYKQLLTGDTSDNIPGLKGVGPKTALKMLDGQNLVEQWESVVAAYMSKGGENWEDYLKEQGQLLWIRRKNGEMWEPDLTPVPNDEQIEVSMY